MSMKGFLRLVRHRILVLDARLITALSELNGIVPPVNNDGSKSTTYQRKSIGAYGITRGVAATSVGVPKAQAKDDCR